MGLHLRFGEGIEIEGFLAGHEVAQTNMQPKNESPKTMVLGKVGRKHGVPC